jgi:hypothetical protein
MFDDRKKQGITCGAVVLASLVLTAGAIADDGNRFGETVDVRVINIEVVVTDAGGQRVPGLGPDDLRLLVDGKPASIEYFTEIRNAAAVFADGQIEGAGPPPPAALPADAEEAMPTNILVFVDEVFPEPLDRNRALRGLEGALDGLGPADQVAVVAYAGDRLELLSDWTGSETALRSVLSNAAKRSTGGYMRRFEMRLGALGEKGSMSEIPMVPVVFRSAGPPGPNSVSRFKGTIELRKGAHDIVVTAYDPLGDRLLARRIHVAPTDR